MDKIGKMVGRLSMIYIMFIAAIVFGKSMGIITDTGIVVSVIMISAVSTIYVTYRLFLAILVMVDSIILNNIQVVIEYLENKENLKLPTDRDGRMRMIMNQILQIRLSKRDKIIKTY